MILLLWSGEVCADADVVIVANKDVPVSELDRAAVKDIFLGRMATWKNGEKIVPAILKSESKVREAFLRTVVRKSPAQFLTYWRRAIFTGTGTPPRAFASEAELLEFIAGTGGAIGYIGSSPSHPGVKVIAVK